MSILIKGTEMPCACVSCALYDGDLYWCRGAKKEVLYSPEDKRATCCPIVHVPPHGRLIDADELEALVYAIIAAYDSAPGGTWEDQRLIRAWLVSMAETIEDAPTIIEAEEGGKRP